MRRTIVTVLAATGVAASTLIAPVIAEAQVYYANCTALHRDFAHGVAKSRRAARREHRATGYPTAAYRRHARKVYWANHSSLDADHDGVACEA